MPETFCELHALPLREDTIPIRYGRPKFNLKEREARQKLFPHANSFYRGGCIVREAKRARVSYCPECRKAETEWQETRKRQ
jgi:hypothetical protein